MTVKPDNRRYIVLKSLAIIFAGLTWAAPVAVFFIPILIWGKDGRSSPLAVPAEMVLALLFGVGFLKIAFALGKAADRQRRGHCLPSEWIKS